MTPHNEEKQSLKRTDTQAAPASTQLDDVVPEELNKLSKDALRRIRALKQLQLNELNILADYHERVHQLSIDFEKLYLPIRQKRASIVNGEYEPTEEECRLPLIHDANPDELKKLEEAASDDKSTGIKDFWLNVLKRAPGMICMREQDMEALKHLRDITCEMHSDPHGYTISFHFSENDFFTNTVLKKRYIMAMKPDPEMPFEYDGPVIETSVGEEIHWKAGKDLVKAAKGKKRDSDGQPIKEPSIPSFFSFFSATPKKISTAANPLSPAEEDEVLEDFEAGELIRMQMVPNAVLVLTNEVVPEEDEDEDDDELLDEDYDMSSYDGSSEDDPSSNDEDQGKVVAGRKGNKPEYLY